MLTLHLFIQSSATAALELNGRELEPGHALLVAISDPARKQQRSDAKASEKEVVVTQMSKFVKKDDLIKLFKPVSRTSLHLSTFEKETTHEPLLLLFSFTSSQYGTIKDIRMTLDADGNTRGAAFVEFEEEVGFLRLAFQKSRRSLTPFLFLLVFGQSRTRSQQFRDQEATYRCHSS